MEGREQPGPVNAPIAAAGRRKQSRAPVGPSCTSSSWLRSVSVSLLTGLGANLEMRVGRRQLICRVSIFAVRIGVEQNKTDQRYRARLMQEIDYSAQGD